MFEKVNPCHPDKLADRIAGALVDMAYAKETDPRIALRRRSKHLSAPNTTNMLSDIRQSKSVFYNSIPNALQELLDL